MKATGLAFLIVSSITANLASATIVKIPLFVENKRALVPMKEVNRKHKTKFPEFLILDSAKKGSLETARNLYWDLSAKLEEQDLQLASDTPGVNSIKDLGTCYLGKPAVAVDLITSMSDSIYSDQLGLIGWKYKNEKHLEEYDDEETEKYILENSQGWREFKGTDDSILILTHESDGGEEINEGLVTRCK